MKNIKQQTNDECLLCAISNIYQQDIRKAVREEFPDKKGFNADYLRKIIESFSTNDETMVNYYNTSMIDNPVKLTSTELFELTSDEAKKEDKDVMDLFYFKGFIGTKINNIFHMLSFAIQVTTGKIIVFDSAKDNYVIYNNPIELINNYDIYRVDYITYIDSYHVNTYPIFSEYFDI